VIRAEAVNSWHNRCAVSVVVSLPVVASASVVAVVGAGDPASSRLVYAMVVGLALIGMAFVLLGVWVLRQTRPDLEVLAPLERMGDGDWKKRDPSTQRRMLDEVRPDGAQPLVPEPLPPPLDDEFEQADHPVSSFSDLGPGIVAEQRDSTPPHLDVDFGLELPAGDDEITTDDETESAADEDLEPGSDSDEALSDPRG
jgi:hypothetical protein